MLTEGTMALDWIQNDLDPSDGVTTRQQELSFFVSAQLRVLEELPKPHYQRDWTFIAEMWAGPRYQSGVLFPPLQTAIENLERVRRIELTAENAIKLRHYRDLHGEYPNPAEWDMPIDPLSGGPMIYRRTATGFEITGSLPDDEHPLAWQWQ